MNQVMENIKARRSIRKYKDEKLSKEEIEYLLSAAMSAPSAGNAQPWEFVVIDNKEILNEIPKFHQYSSMLKEASHAILVCGNIDLEKYQGFWVQDCSAATQNMLLAATAKDIGSVWLGVYPEEDRIEGLRKLLDLPDNVIPFSLVSLGYPAENKGSVDRYSEDKVHYNKY
ncbi:nitroreductase family protein [Natronospora cellulosivora (SeqCode)]